MLAVPVVASWVGYWMAAIGLRQVVAKTRCVLGWLFTGTGLLHTFHGVARSVAVDRVSVEPHKSNWDSETANRSTSERSLDERPTAHIRRAADQANNF